MKMAKVRCSVLFMQPQSVLLKWAIPNLAYKEFGVLARQLCPSHQNSSDFSSLELCNLYTFPAKYHGTRNHGCVPHYKQTSHSNPKKPFSRYAEHQMCLIAQE